LSDVESYVRRIMERFEDYFKNCSSIEILGLLIALHKLQSKLFDLFLVRIGVEAQKIQKRDMER